MAMPSSLANCSKRSSMTLSDEQLDRLEQITDLTQSLREKIEVFLDGHRKVMALARLRQAEVECKMGIGEIGPSRSTGTDSDADEL